MKEISYGIAIAFLFLSVLLSATVWYFSPTPSTKTEAVARAILASAPLGWGIALLLGVILLWR